MLRDNTPHIEQISRDELQPPVRPQSLAIRYGRAETNRQLGPPDICRTVKFGTCSQVLVRRSLLLKFKPRSKVEGKSLWLWNIYAPVGRRLVPMQIMSRSRGRMDPSGSIAFRQHFP